MRNSNLIISAAVAISAIAGSGAASAADLPAQTYTKAPAMVDPGYNWTGFYVGLNAGYAWGVGHANYTVDPFFSGASVGTPPGDSGRAALAAASTRIASGGFLGGVQAGYNWQVRNIVIGIESDFNALNLNNTSNTAGLSGTGVPWVNNVRTSIQTNWLLTVRPRVGVTWNQSLIYATGGLAVTNLKTFQSQSNNDVFAGGFFPGYTESVSGSTTKVGWTVGAGMEYALSNHWSVKGEYLYTDFGHVNLTGTTIDSGTFGFGGIPFNHTFDLHTNSVRGGVNYKF
jgi:outer membrane immunogenic protein